MDAEHRIAMLNARLHKLMCREKANEWVQRKIRREIRKLEESLQNPQELCTETDEAALK